MHIYSACNRSCQTSINRKDIHARFAIIAVQKGRTCVCEKKQGEQKLNRRGERGRSMQAPKVVSICCERPRRVCCAAIRVGCVEFQRRDGEGRYVERESKASIVQKLANRVTRAFVSLSSPNPVEAAKRRPSKAESCNSKWCCNSSAAGVLNN